MVVDVGGCHELFEDGGAFVVQSLEFGSEACFDKECMGTFVGCKDCFCGSVGDRFTVNVVAVVVVENKEEAIAVARWDGEWTCLVSVDLAGGYVGHSSKTIMGSAGGEIGKLDREVGFWCRV